MASGSRHDAAARRLLHYAVIGSAAGLVAGGNPAHTAALLAGLLLGRYAGPDVRDQHQVRNEGEKQVRQDFGRALGALWVAYWTPLAWLIPHRHITSHLPGFATAIAFGYLFVPWLWLAHWLLQPPVPAETWIMSWLLSDLAYWLFVGWFAQDILHWWMDGCPIKFDRS